jgi:hypothetical protein
VQLLDDVKVTDSVSVNRQQTAASKPNDAIAQQA